jgi:UDP-N-acetylenolpyruvoylglucosamine reductase
MHEGEFMFVLILGSMMGAAVTLLIQWYGRRKVKAALKQEGLTPTRQTELLINENNAVRGQVLRLEERLSVMERIATDSSMNLGREIERLR